MTFYKNRKKKGLGYFQALLRYIFKNV